MRFVLKLHETMMFSSSRIIILLSFNMLFIIFNLFIILCCINGYQNKYIIHTIKKYHIQSISKLTIHYSIQSSIISSIMDSPLYIPIVNIARNTMVKTAEKIGIDWQNKVFKIVIDIVISLNQDR